MMSITLIWTHYALFRDSDMSISKINNECWGGQKFKNQAIPLIITIISILAPTQLSYAPAFLFFFFLQFMMKISGGKGVNKMCCKELFPVISWLGNVNTHKCKNECNPSTNTPCNAKMKHLIST